MPQEPKKIEKESVAIAKEKNQDEAKKENK